MIPNHQTEIFASLLESRMIDLGVRGDLARQVASRMKPVRIEGSEIYANAGNDVYADTIITSYLDEINGLVQQVWGTSARLVLVNENTGIPTRPAKAKPQLENQEQVPPPLSDIFAYSSDAQSPTLASAGPSSLEVMDDGLSAADDNLDLSKLELNPQMTFANFVRGDSNQSAYTACEAVTKSPGKFNNPVFIYGGVGLGKTHLLQAVAHEMRRLHPKWNVIYLQSQEFINGFITAIRHKKTEEYRRGLANCDVLLVDDIQFLESKDSTQLEFFFIFNVLCTRKKQILLTSDKYPRDIPKLEERLRSRFLQGLLLSIDSPSYEERVAIIRHKAERQKLFLSDNIVDFIATHAKSHVRQIEGVISNLYLQQSITGRPPTIELATHYLRSIVKIQRATTDVAAIQRTVASYFNLKTSELLSSSRAAKLVMPRHVAMFLARDILNMNYAEIATAFERKDHTTVMHAEERIRKLIAEDHSTRAQVAELKQLLEQNQG